MSVRVWQSSQELDLHRRGALGNQVLLQVLVWLGRKTAGLLALGPLFIATTEAIPPPFWSSNFNALPDAYRARGHVEVFSSALWLFLASGQYKKTCDNRAIIASNSQAYRISSSTASVACCCLMLVRSHSLRRQQVAEPKGGSQASCIYDRKTLESTRVNSHQHGSLGSGQSYPVAELGKGH